MGDSITNDEASTGVRKRGQKRPRPENEGAVIQCPYLDTIDRASLDFDFEKLCVESLKNLNVYGCLVCGMYFHGRARGTPAYNHSLAQGHHVFINLETGIVYCLPDLYEVKDASLTDIKYNLNPKYTKEQIKDVLQQLKTCRGLDGQEFRPGFVGLNNLKCTDNLNVVIQSLARIPEIMNFFMLPLEYKGAERISPLTQRFGELLRKMWNAKAFKGQVSPHELMQAVTLRSNKKFQIGVRGCPVELLQFLLNKLHEDDVKGRHLKKAPKSIIYSTFRGSVKMTAQKVKITEDAQGNKVETEVGEPETKEMPFMHLQFDLPETPLFKDDSEKNIIPQVPLFTLLHKYDGQQTAIQPIRGQVNLANRVQYIVTKLPKFLIFCYKRFKMNYWFEEKNKTIVNFPVKSLDMRDFCSPEEGASLRNCKYDLIANVCHEGTDREDGFYKVHVIHKASGEWFEVTDLMVKDAVPQEISCTAPYFQIWEAQDYTRSAPDPEMVLQLKAAAEAAAAGNEAAGKAP